ncbi:TetR family transcriptional regulator [Salsuginibacillus halophilus]|uniref:TetR family transcriptional regulator n=1 Tax=Salsuginibacillus halophilus TaxID=517424 RepID=A0A2P8HI18_9BACI|nr:TetR family transcriptional regulator [Salsuginibacillus halophilus]PSL45872.1 TetR family transcriptional regulator [Salsuginibacillus halophilus]
MSPKMGMEEIRREQSIAAARHCILTYGMPHFSIKDVAAAAGVSTGIIYHYFAGKNDLMAQVLKASFSETERAVEEAVTAADTPDAKVKAYIDTVAAVPKENPDFYRLLLNFLSEAPYREEIQSIVDKFFSNLTTFLTELLEDAQSPATPDELARLMISQAMGLGLYEAVLPHHNVPHDSFVRIFQTYIDSRK